MTDDMVMRSVYLRPLQDTQLRQLARNLDVTKSDLIRAAISRQLIEWLKSNDRQQLLEEVAVGLRDEAAIRRGRPGRDRTRTKREPLTGVLAAVQGGEVAETPAVADSREVSRDALV